MIKGIMKAVKERERTARAWRLKERTFRLHIDHIGNLDGDVWAVSIPTDKKYLTAHNVQCEVPLDTVRQKKQPRAYLAGKGYVLYWKDDRGYKKVIIF